MQIQVSGRGVDVGESLRSHIQASVDDRVNKYIDRVNSINAVVAKDAHLFRVDLTGNVGTHSGFTVRSRGESTDVYAAFDDAIDKAAKQLRRYKRKITNHHKDITDEPSFTATKRVIPSDIGEKEEESAALVIAEKATKIETLTVSQAVMKMDLQHLPALLLFNRGTGRLNVVYRREDGNISWVDPEAKAA